MKKKTAIITFHCVPNYGAVLQAYALQTKLKEVSSEAGIVDYRPSRLTAEYKDISFYSIFSVAGSLWSLNSFRKKKKKFAQFENEYLDLIPCDERNGTVILKDATPDIVFLGSDQIWNPDITHGFDRVYFGDIIVNAPFRAASYAASIGKKNFTEEEKTQYQEIIKMNADLLMQLVNDILDMSKIEAGTLEFVYSTVDINLLLSDLQRLFQMRINDAGGKVQIIAEPSLSSCLIQTDRNRVAQVLSLIHI